MKTEVELCLAKRGFESNEELVVLARERAAEKGSWGVMALRWSGVDVVVDALLASSRELWAQVLRSGDVKFELLDS